MARQTNRCLSSPLYKPPAPSTEPPFPDDAVSTANMTRQQKGAIWQHIKEHEPDQVEFLQDPLVKKLIAEGAAAVFPRALVQRALNPRKTKA